MNVIKEPVQPIYEIVIRLTLDEVKQFREEIQYLHFPMAKSKSVVRDLNSWLSNIEST